MRKGTGLKYRLFYSVAFLFCLMSSNFAQEYGHWEIIDSTNLPREEHASIVMADGNVMVTGGSTGYTTGYSSSAEIYNVATNTWHFVDSMNAARAAHSMVLLQDSSILAISGFQLNSCEKYNPNSGMWSFVDSIKKVRDRGFTTTILDNGKILITGGWYFDGSQAEFVKECEIYDPIINEWSIVDSLSIGRLYHSATFLKDGRVLVIGGLSPNSWLKSCEIFDPTTGQWSLTDSLSIERGDHSAVVLPDGKVLVTGGGNLNNLAILSCELYDPVTESWEVVGSTDFPHTAHSSILLSDSLIMLVGGAIGPASGELFSPKTFSSVFLNTLPFQKYESTVHLLPDGRIINVGGWAIDGMFFLPTETCLMYYPNVTSIASTQDKLTGFSLGQNYPNPFNPFTVIEYSLSTTSFVELKIYDILGNEIVSLVSEEKTAGKHSVKFNAEGFPSGIYLYRLSSKYFTETKKLILLK